jgi:hypothetical protein
MLIAMTVTGYYFIHIVSRRIVVFSVIDIIVNTVP